MLELSVRYGSVHETMRSTRHAPRALDTSVHADAMDVENLVDGWWLTA